MARRLRFSLETLRPKKVMKGCHISCCGVYIGMYATI